MVHILGCCFGRPGRIQVTGAGFLLWVRLPLFTDLNFAMWKYHLEHGFWDIPLTYGQLLTWVLLVCSYIFFLSFLFPLRLALLDPWDWSLFCLLASPVPPGFLPLLDASGLRILIIASVSSVLYPLSHHLIY